MCLLVDETADCRNQYIANCLVEKVSEKESGKIYPLFPRELERTNHATINLLVCGSKHKCLLCGIPLYKKILM
jgi:hypothetical protein